MAVPAYIPLGEGLVNSIALGNEGRRRDQENALSQQRFGMEQQQFAQQQNMLAQKQKQDADAQDVAQTYARMKAGDPTAAQYAIQKMSQAHPEFAAFAQQNPQGAVQAAMSAMEQQLGIDNSAMQKAQFEADQRAKLQQSGFANDQVLAEARAKADAAAAAQQHGYRLDEIRASGKQARETNATKPLAQTAVQPSEGERVAANYLGRMQASEKLLGNYQPSFTDYAAARSVMSSGPAVATIANKVLSQEGQKYYQAAADWVRAKLRKESGAVIAPAEMEQEIKTYFPIPGDTKATIAQKKQARLQAQAGMQEMGGRAVASPSNPGVVDWNSL